MTRYVLLRILQGLVTLFIVAMITFALTHLLGDPVRLLLPVTATQAQYDALRHTLGYDQPVAVQFFRFLGELLTGQLGNSTTYGVPALSLVIKAFGVTVTLTALALVVAVVVGVPLGIWAGYRPGGVADRISSLVATIGQAVPGFVLGILAILLFSVELHLLPASGWGSPATMILPVLTLAVYAGSLVIRITRSSTRDVMAQPFIVLARAKGLSELQVIGKHSIRATLVPLVTVIGLQFAVLLTGAFIIESIFSIPGIGQLVVAAVQQRDQNVIIATIIVAAAGFVLVNLVTDLVYAVIDPRIVVNAGRSAQ
jgi:peptide/nickel transport system permease protein